MRVGAGFLERLCDVGTARELRREVVDVEDMDHDARRVLVATVRSDQRQLVLRTRRH